MCIYFAPPTIFYYKSSKQEYECRQIYWEYFALDRQRFNERIAKVALVIEPVLAKKVLVYYQLCA